MLVYLIVKLKWIFRVFLIKNVDFFFIGIEEIICMETIGIFIMLVI